MVIDEGVPRVSDQASATAILIEGGLHRLCCGHGAAADDIFGTGDGRGAVGGEEGDAVGNSLGSDGRPIGIPLNASMIIRLLPPNRCWPFGRAAPPVPISNDPDLQPAERMMRLGQSYGPTKGR